jgi:hypothetical protein
MFYPGILPFPCIPYLIPNRYNPCLQIRNIFPWYVHWIIIIKNNIIIIIILSVVVWREGHRLRVIENRVLRRISKRDKVTGEWRKLHSEELHNLYSSPDIIRQIKSRRIRWAGHVARMGEETEVYKVLVGMPEGKRPLRRPRRRWEDGIRMDLRGDWLGGWGVDRIRLAQDRDRWRAVVSAVMNLQVIVPRI